MLSKADARAISGTAGLATRVGCGLAWVAVTRSPSSIQSKLLLSNLVTTTPQLSPIRCWTHLNHVSTPTPQHARQTKHTHRALQTSARNLARPPARRMGRAGAYSVGIKMGPCSARCWVKNRRSSLTHVFVIFHRLSRFGQIERAISGVVRVTL